MRKCIGTQLPLNFKTFNLVVFWASHYETFHNPISVGLFRRFEVRGWSYGSSMISNKKIKQIYPSVQYFARAQNEKKNEE